MPNKHFQLGQIGQFLFNWLLTTFVIGVQKMNVSDKHLIFNTTFGGNMADNQQQKINLQMCIRY